MIFKGRLLENILFKLQSSPSQCRLSDYLFIFSMATVSHANFDPIQLEIMPRSFSSLATLAAPSEHLQVLQIEIGNNG